MIGIELEYMVVDEQSLDVRPVVDQLMKSVSGDWTTDLAREPIAWSNELALHVLEFKVNPPVQFFDGVAEQFCHAIASAEFQLQSFDARLLPGAMHPWMDPTTEMKLWPHGDNDVYEVYDEIFGARGHGWANLQSMHLNLSFEDGESFARLHAAARLVLPMLPALAASSPVCDGAPTGVLNTRLRTYETKLERLPRMVGQLIPEPIFSTEEYFSRIIEPIYADLAIYDPMALLRHDWVNGRGAIPRFDRGSLEIRVLDTQENSAADLAVAEIVVGLIEHLVAETSASLEQQKSWSTQRLRRIFDATVLDADFAQIEDLDYLALFGLCTSANGQEFWRHVAEHLVQLSPSAREPIRLIGEQGCLARRIMARLAPQPSRDELRAVYRELADCLRFAKPFVV